MKKIEFKASNTARKFFKKHNEIFIKFKENIIKEIKMEYKPDIKKLKGYPDLLRMRLGNYRVVYKVENDKIIIISILMAGHRKDVYNKF